MEASSSGVVPCTRMSVSTAPAAIALTVIPVGPSSRARERVKPDDGGLGRGVRGLAEHPAALLRGHRGHVHDPAVAAVDHVRQERLGDQVGAGGVDREDLVPQLQGGFQERHRGGDPGDVQHRPDGGQVGGVHGVPGGEHRVLVGDVDGAAEGGHPVLLGQFGGQLLRGVPVQVQAGDGPAVPGEPVGGGPADAALGADSGDDDGALRAAGHGIPPAEGRPRVAARKRGPGPRLRNSPGPRWPSETILTCRLLTVNR